MSAPIPAFADYIKEFLLEANASKEGLGAVLSQNKQMGDITWLSMVVEPLQLMKKTTIPPNWSS